MGGQVTEYTWDHRNRLTSVIDRVSAAGAKTQQVEYIYDAFDQLTGKRVTTQFTSTGAPTNWSRYEVFAWADGQEVLRFVDSDGQGAQPARIANRYLSGAAVDQLLADEQYAIGTGPAVTATTASAVEGNTLWALTDHLGSVRDLVDNHGVIREHNVYDSFGRLVREVDYNAAGQVIASTDPAAVDTLFGYTGRLFDPHTGLQYNRARWYDASTGRWLSQDPIGFAAGDANLYRYVGNGPTNSTDPSGLETVVIGGVKTTVTRKGHHVFPVELWEWSGIDPSLYAELDSARIGIGNPHNYARHGAVTGYSGHVKVEFSNKLREFMKSQRITDGKLTISQQRIFMSDFVNHLKNCSSDDYIRGFNKAVKSGGIAKVKTWYTSTGQHIAKPVLEGLQTVSGVATASKVTKIGQVFIKKGGKYVFAPFIAAMIYNNARAGGRSHLESATLAGIEVVNPFPVGVEEVNAAGEYYEDLVAKSKLIGQGLADPEDYVGTRWYEMVKNRQWLRQLKEETGACPSGDGSGYEW